VTDGPELPVVLVTVGTDHHPFDRLIGWVDRWAAANAGRVQVVVQYGNSVAPTIAEGSAFVPYDELQNLFERATVVVSHGGPATITEARRHGRLPVCVGRDPSLGEHVDDHQMRFVRRASAAGLVAEAETESELDSLLNRALVAPDELRFTPAGHGSWSGTELSGPIATVARVGELVSDLVARSKRAPRDTTVLYIGGLGRSGSTLLERTLGQLDGTVCIGETVHLWERGVLADEPCGCGEPFHSCPFWSEVGEQAFGGWERLHIERLLRLRHAVDRTRNAPLLAMPGIAPGFASKLAVYRRALRQLYRAVADVSGASVIVDSSKHASFAYVLKGTPGIDLRVLQVVRDSPAVAYSWAKWVERPEGASAGTVGTDRYMARWSPAHTSVQWTVQNALVQALPVFGVPVLRTRYEDFVRSPGETVRPVFGFLGRPEDEATLSALDDGVVDLRVSHTVSGNPMRFRTGQVRIRADEEWRTGLMPSDRRLVAAMTAPLRLWYGYPVRQKPPSDSSLSEGGQAA
jgi:UDP-N-acetylglucosamine transferase subunit ALG13